jgi:hypothetical protein
MVFGLRTGFELGAGAFRKQVLRCSEAVTGLEFETLPAAEAFVSDWNRFVDRAWPRAPEAGDLGESYGRVAPLPLSS